ncbi:MAG: M14 family metallopeptidase [Bacteroidota bacterium]
MRTIALLIVFWMVLLVLSCKESTEEDQSSFSTPFERSQGVETATYQEVIDFYLALAKEFPEINVQTIGETDSGHALHLVTYNPDGNFNFQKIRQEKAILLVNNGIHPGESDGIDATMLLFRDLAEKTIPSPKNTVLTTLPVYNIGGMLNRNSTTRVNQNGPKAYGFRGNAKNYDLNRDFIKMDTKNTKTFASIFHLTKPDVFIDNHVSNGADYQYTLTHLFTQHNRLGGDMGDYLSNVMVPKLEERLNTADWDITPYVNVFNRPPETGFNQFMDHPRYSTGYTTLWNTFGVMLETHMLKPYDQRVKGTYTFMQEMLGLLDADYQKIKQLRQQAFEEDLEMTSYPIQWDLDTTKTTTIRFKGYKADTLTSEVTGLPRLKYNKEMPFEKMVSYNNWYKGKDSIMVPAAYIVKRGWQNIMEHLTANEIDFFELDKDTLLEVGMYRIVNFKTYTSPYEGHYPHYETTVVSSKNTIAFQKGDFVIPTQQAGIRYLLETLEPGAVDSFFNWNFFDTVLQRKEGFSPYVFEDLAEQLLMENQPLRDSLVYRKSTDEAFAQNWYAQLNWIFQNSKYYEKAHMQYPVYRILKGSVAEKLLED